MKLGLLEPRAAAARDRAKLRRRWTIYLVRGGTEEIVLVRRLSWHGGEMEEIFLASTAKRVGGKESGIARNKIEVKRKKKREDIFPFFKGIYSLLVTDSNLISKWVT